MIMKTRASTCLPDWNTIVHASSKCHKPWRSCPKSVNIAQTMAICIDLRRILHAPVSID